MIRCLVSGTLHGEPLVRTSANGNPFTTAKLRADGKDGASIWCSLIAFGPEGERLAIVKAGEALSVSGRAEVTAWLNREGEAKAGLSLVVDELITLKAKPRPPQEQTRRPTPRRRYQNNPPVVAEPAAPFDDLDDWTP